tara:strand:- start:4735 stop:5421 length:687 start_codon:yes stop_codon:yes gene_type:complete
MSDLKPLTITIDGPAGVGKGSLSKNLAQHFALHYLDSGAVYRALAVDALAKGVSADDEMRLTQLAIGLNLEFPASEGYATFVAGSNVESLLRTEDCSLMASKIASLAPVRAQLLALQRRFQQAPGLVADGRDMGTVVFTEASFKIFLDASCEERAQRRYKQLINQGLSANFDALFASIRERDLRDRTRATAPLREADDAWVIDSSNLSEKEVFQKVVASVQKHIKERD